MPQQNISSEQATQLIANVLLAEAASDGPQGMEFVADTMWNRGQSRKLPLHMIATQSALNKKGVRVYQYTGAGRKDLPEFVGQQPQILRNLALQIAQERMHPDYQPQYPGIENYVTKDLYENRFRPNVSEWVRTYEPAGTIGSHVALRPPRRRR